MNARNLVHNGRAVANQIEIFHKGYRIFKSYETKVAIEDPDGLYIINSEYWDYSPTTLKYFKIFMSWEHMTKKQIEKFMHMKPEKYVLATDKRVVEDFYFISNL